jgi:hypothetical protein
MYKGTDVPELLSNGGRTRSEEQAEKSAKALRKPFFNQSLGTMTRDHESWSSISSGDLAPMRITQTLPPATIALSIAASLLWASWAAVGSRM